MNLVQLVCPQEWAQATHHYRPPAAAAVLLAASALLSAGVESVALVVLAALVMMVMLDLVMMKYSLVSFVRTTQKGLFSRHLKSPYFPLSSRWWV